MLPKVVSLPVRVSLNATRSVIGLTFKVSSRLAEEIVQLLYPISSPPPSEQRPHGQADQGPAQPPAAAAAAAAKPTTAAAPGRSSTASQTTRRPLSPPAPAAPQAVEEAYAQTAITRAQRNTKTVDDRDELVAEFAESGAEDGAGAGLHFGQPWAGYDAAPAKLIAERIADADAAELAVIELYEQAHKARRTVLKAAERRLRVLSPGADAPPVVEAVAAVDSSAFERV